MKRHNMYSMRKKAWRERERWGGRKGGGGGEREGGREGERYYYSCPYLLFAGNHLLLSSPVQFLKLFGSIFGEL